MLGLLTALLGLAAVDSLNPSAIWVTIYLTLTGARYLGRVLSYLAGVFTCYLGIGVLLLMGLDTWGDWLGHVLSTPTAYAAQLALGAALLIYASLAPNRSRSTGREWRPRSLHRGALFLLGWLVSVVEFSTALPYLGAIALISRADLALPLAVALLAGYTAVMLVPPLAIVAAYSVAERRMGDRMQRWQERVRGGARGAWLWILGLLGFVLVADALAYFRFFGIVDVPEVTSPG
jgi:cytochrome c biogenesis protein CcdA